MKKTYFSICNLAKKCISRQVKFDNKITFLYYCYVMYKLILTDNVAFLAFLLAVGSLVLFGVVLKKMIMHPDKEVEPVDETASGEEDTQKSKMRQDSETGLALIEAHLNAITQEIAEIKQQINYLSSKVENPPPSSETELLRKQLSSITTKLETIQSFLTKLTQD
ncbi:MAG: hypothetical protein AB1633_03960 [Elusimicrobiota bacterium]